MSVVIVMEFPQRKRQRLKEFNYSTPGCYFVTVLTHKRQHLFWNNGEINQFGKIVEENILGLPRHYFPIKIDKYIIMPDHIHLLITIGCDALPKSDDILFKDLRKEINHPNLSDIIGSLKSYSTKDIHRLYPKLQIWHKSFYDHIITNQKEYDEIWDYIEANPIRWQIKHKQTTAERAEPRSLQDK